MGQILSNGEVTYITRTDMVIRSSGGGGVVGRIIVIPEKIVYSDTPPEPKCIEIEQGFDINCITLVAEEATEKCITISVENPSLDIEPEITPDEGCSEYTDRPTFEILTVNGEAPILHKNLDSEGLVYVTTNDVVVISITNYDENTTYDTPYTSLDTASLEHLGSNYLYDNGGGELVFVIEPFYEVLDGVGVEIWIYATQGEKCRNVSEKWMGIKTMEQSDKPILNPCPVDDFFDGEVYLQKILNYKEYTEYTTLTVTSGTISINNENLSWVTPVVKGQYFLSIRATDSLKYESVETICYITVGDGGWILYNVEYREDFKAVFSTFRGEFTWSTLGGILWCDVTLSYHKNREDFKTYINTLQLPIICSGGLGWGKVYNSQEERWVHTSNIGVSCDDGGTHRPSSISYGSSGDKNHNYYRDWDGVKELDLIKSLNDNVKSGISSFWGYMSSFADGDEQGYVPHPNGSPDIILAGWDMHYNRYSGSKAEIFSFIMNTYYRHTGL